MFHNVSCKNIEDIHLLLQFVVEIKSFFVSSLESGDNSSGAIFSCLSAF